MKKLLTSLLFTFLSSSVVAQDYHELSRPERRTVSCFQVMELNDGNLLSLEDHGYVENGEWINQGAYLMKINDKAELLDSLFIEFPYKINFYNIIQNPFEEESYIFAGFYLNADDSKYHYKAVFFDNNLNVTDMIDKHVPCAKARLSETLRKPLLGVDNNWIVSAYDSNYNFVFLEISIWGDIIKEKVSDINVHEYERTYEPLFIYDEEEKLYGFLCNDIVNFTPDYYDTDGHTTLFLINKDMKKHASYSFYKMDDLWISPKVDPVMIVKESGELVMVAVFQSPMLNNKYILITEFDKDMNIVKCKTIDKDAGTLGYSDIFIHHKPISISEDGSLYLSWCLYYEDEDYIQHFVTLLDKDYNIEWEKMYYESNNAWIWRFPNIVSMQTLSNGNLAMAGINIYDYDDVYSTHPYVVIFEDNSSLTSEQPYLVLPYSFYPNPADDAISLRFSPDVNCEKVEIYSLDGKLCHAQNFNFNTIDINTLSSGIYMMKVSLSNGNVYTEKVVKK